MVYEHLHNIANIFKQRRLIHMQSSRDKRLKPRIVAPKLPSRRGCMNFDKHLHNIHISYILLIKLLTFFSVNWSKASSKKKNSSHTPLPSSCNLFFCLYVIMLY
jgi:hypothetical protein